MHEHQEKNRNNLSHAAANIHEESSGISLIPPPFHLQANPLPPTQNPDSFIQHQEEDQFLLSSLKVEALPTESDSAQGIQGNEIIQRNPVKTVSSAVIKRALRFLAKRSKTISRHVARHTRHIARAGAHSVFKNPNTVKKLAKRTLESADNVVVQAGRRRTRYVIEKQFNRVIGKDGETIMKIVVEASGRIVTAYPVKAFTRSGAAAGAAMYVALDSAAAEAQDKFQQINQQADQMIQAAEPSIWEDIFNDIITLGLYGGSLNQGEAAYLHVRDETQKVIDEAVTEVIQHIEETEQRSLGPEEREKVRQFVTQGLTVSSQLEELQ